MKMILAALAATTMLALPAQAATVFGDTTSGATFHRAEEWKALSPYGTSTNYQVHAFQVSQTASYRITVTGTDPDGWDTHLSVYKDSFDAADALKNLFVFNDDLGGIIGLSGFTSQVFVAGTTYYAVVSGWGNRDAGAYSFVANPVGTGSFNFISAAAPVPEPGSWAMMIGGFGLAGAALRRRRVKISYAAA